MRAPDDPSDESVAAAATARMLGIEHEIVEMPRAEFSLDQLMDAYQRAVSSSFGAGDALGVECCEGPRQGPSDW